MGFYMANMLHGREEEGSIPVGSQQALGKCICFLLPIFVVLFSLGFTIHLSIGFACRRESFPLSIITGMDGTEKTWQVEVV
jgi:hypothetical protein